ncbi:MurR/RpiR family transcriptional regulator [Vagococcus luciliae]|uniref:HTH-type transcriptional regulator GlvR n=1 Tax=Vagococcus luciliae TaxID=2920380 RepID=A0ABY5NZ37_9ENTE|nr:MurR/RpiR family transcriptional regulator [Vagococcus luciliae]UUV98915.1 HTH-type transcriptional regulator GlvR [Vagococcus luciliae]
MNFDQHIQVYFESLSVSEKEIIYYIQNHKQEVVNLSAVDFAEKVLSSKSSISRLAQKLNYKGFSEMKYAIEQDLNKAIVAPFDLVDNIRQNIDKTFQYAEQVNFQPLLSQMKNAKNILIYATGFTQNNYSKDFSNELFLSNRPNFLISGETSFEIISQTLTQNDLVFIASLGGNTESIQNTVKFLNINKIPICSVTSFGKNFLTDYSNYQLFYEISNVPSPISENCTNMIGLNIILSILSQKYREFILFDE